MRCVMLLGFVAALLAMPTSATAATCSDYSTQADAQRAGDTRDADGDGIYCESLPCPCSPGAGSTSPPPAPPRPPLSVKPACSRTTVVQRLRFSAAKYPNIKTHTEAAITKGWPRILVLNRPNADKRRDRLLEESGLPPRADEDRDEYPPAVGAVAPMATRKALCAASTRSAGWPT
jgi:hypothetical protein